MKKNNKWSEEAQCTALFILFCLLSVMLLVFLEIVIPMLGVPNVL